jgi:hypothetical protein
MLADLSFIKVSEILQFGLHQYLDAIQLRLTEISDAVYKDFCEWLEQPEEVESNQ